MSDIFKVKVNDQWIGLNAMKGEQGIQGIQGIQGPVGPQGPQGITGPQGEQGIQGPIGPIGPQGLQGIQGPKGDRGEKGDTGNTGPQGVQGPQGIQGEKGDKGDTATITIGTVTQGSSMSVTNSGTANDAIFDFVLVKGDKGDTGDTGPTGPQGIQGETGPQGPIGPQGPTGAAAGFSGVTGAYVTELAPGASPSVTAWTSGPATAKDLYFEFGLPGTPKFSEVTIPTSSWTSSGGSYTATVSLSGISSSSRVLVGAKSTSMSTVMQNIIYCSGQGSDSLSFTAGVQPSTSVTFGVYWV